jgi:TolB protein
MTNQWTRFVQRIVSTALLAISVLGLAQTAAGSHGSLIAFERGSTDGKRTDIYLMNVDGSGVRRLTSIGHAENPDWSRDGRIAFDVYRGKRFDAIVHDVFVMNADGSNVHRLTKGGLSRAPTWSPDGRTILFNRGSGLAVMNADGSGVHILVKDLGGGDTGGGAWSPDGRKIAFGEQHHGGWGISVMNSDGSHVRWLTNLSPNGVHSYDTDPDWSPDGRKIAFTTEYDCACDDPSEFNINVVAATGAARGELDVLTTDGVSANPSWSPDGTHIAYDRGHSRSQIHVMNAGGKHKRRLTSNRQSSAKPDWSP